MNKLFLTMTLAFSTMIASAQYQVMTTITSVEDEAGETTYNATDKIGVGYQLMNGVWGTCVYNYAKDSETELMDNVELGLGYSFKVWDNLYVDPNYTMPAKADEAGEREGSLNLSVSYKF
mgnify:CR=1 FL=1